MNQKHALGCLTICLSFIFTACGGPQTSCRSSLRINGASVVDVPQFRTYVASQAGQLAFDCGQVMVDQDPTATISCVLHQFQSGQAFFAVIQDRDSKTSEIFWTGWVRSLADDGTVDTRVRVFMQGNGGIPLNTPTEYECTKASDLPAADPRDPLTCDQVVLLRFDPVPLTASQFCG